MRRQKKENKRAGTFRVYKEVRSSFLLLVRIQPVVFVARQECLTAARFLKPSRKAKSENFSKFKTTNERG